MPETKRQIKPQDDPSHPLNVSYREAARRTGRSAQHVHLVVTGKRQSQRLIKELEPFLKNAETGIGKN